MNRNSRADIKKLISIRNRTLPADFKFILIDRIMTCDYKFSNLHKIILMLHTISRQFCISDVKVF